MKFLKEIFQRFVPALGEIEDSVPVYVYANRHNIGDRLSAEGIKLAVGVEGPECIIEGEQIRSLFGSCRDRPFRLVIGGGGLIKDTFAPFWESLLSSKFRYVIMGIGMCDIKSQNSLFAYELLSNMIERAEFVWVRDTLTSSLIEDRCGIRTNTILCPSVYYINEQYRRKMEKPKKRDRPSVLYVHHKKLVKTAWKEDSLIQDMVRRVCRMNKFSYAETDNLCKNPDAVLHQYEEADIVISTRLHGCILSYALEKPFIAVSADHKIDSFVQDYCDATLIDINEVSADKIDSIMHTGLPSTPRKKDFYAHIKSIKDAGEIIKLQFLDA